MKDRILICGTNWLGDSVMSMPAVQALKRANPSCRVTMFVKPRVAALWTLSKSVDEILELHPGTSGMLEARRALKEKSFPTALIFPNSFRSGLIPFMARIPERIGMPGHVRRWLLTRTIEPLAGDQRAHQVWEYMKIVGHPMDSDEIELPQLSVSSSVGARAVERFGLGGERNVIGIMPGAARGPSKRWPAEYFVEVGRRLVAFVKPRVLVFGSAKEHALCADVAGGIGSSCANLAGQTSVPELAALLSACRLLLCNDSGGMHIAAACGTRVVAVFGLTDPAKTGPLGTNHHIIQAEGYRVSREIRRKSARAAEAMRSIKPAVVYEAAAHSLSVGV